MKCGAWNSAECCRGVTVLLRHQPSNVLSELT